MSVLCALYWRHVLPVPVTCRPCRLPPEALGGRGSAELGARGVGILPPTDWPTGRHDAVIVGLHNTSPEHYIFCRDIASKR